MEAVQLAGCDVVGMTCLFDFQFPEAVKRISDANLSLAPLLTYSEMLEVASEMEYLSSNELETLTQWREDPAAWTPETY